MIFLFGCLIALLIGRRLGWAISRNLLYSSGWFVCVVVCVAWGVGLAYGVRLFIIVTNPGLLLKIFGYGAGIYISIPNYGLIADSTVAESEMPRHVVVKGLPWVLFIFASVIFAFRMQDTGSVQFALLGFGCIAFFMWQRSVISSEYKRLGLWRSLIYFVLVAFALQIIGMIILHFTNQP